MKTVPPIVLSEELVRVHAHLCGDGGLYRFKTRRKDRINIALIYYFNNNEKLIEAFRKDMNKLFGVRMYYAKKRNWVKVASIRIADYLNQLSEYGARKWRIPSIIKNAPRKYKIEWVKAFCYDEAYVPPKRNYIRIKSMNHVGLKDVKEMLDSIKIDAHITGPNCDKSYYLNIRKMAEFEYFTKKKSRK